MSRLPNESARELDGHSPDATFSALAHDQRRRVLRDLLEAAPQSVSREHLATGIAAATRGKSREDVTDDECDEAMVTLHHNHLPTLIDAGLVEDDSDDHVGLADHPALQDAGILEAVEGTAPADSDSLDALFGSLADGQRRLILDILSHQFGRIHVETLARELEAREQGVAESEVSPTDIEGTLVRLHHVDLPHLSEAGLIEHDPEAKTVAYTGHPALRVPWTHSLFQPEFRGSLTGEAEPGGIGEIEGRERVVSFGQSALESAEEELFCMFTDTQLLKAGCLARIRDAARERDADVYLGTRDPAVKEYVEEHAPEIIVWEPDSDWLNLPVEGDRVGRLLMADRDTVLLGTLKEERSNGLYEEQAMIGEGEHNTLVTMVRQLLTPHLERIDGDTEDVAGEIPL